jgi:GTP-binding protein HflX
VLGELGAGDKPVVPAINKIDLVRPSVVRAISAEIGRGVPISAVRQVGLINLLRRVAQVLPERLVRIRLLVPYAKAGTISQMFSAGRVLKQDYTLRGIQVEAELPKVQARQLKASLRNP